MKILVAGLGSIGRRHLRNLVALGERDIMLYRTHQSTLPEDELAPYPVCTSLSKALQQRPDAVVVSNPTALHLEVAIPAAHAGCHIFIEKPISHSLDGVDALETMVEIAGVQVLVGYQFRFHPGLQVINHLLKAGAIGEPASVRVHWGEYLPGWHPWEDYRQGYAARADLGGGVIRTLCHPFDYLRWLFGEVDSVFAFTGKHTHLDLDVEDTAEIVLQFANGLTGSVHLDYLQRPTEHTLRIVGAEGSICWSNADGAVRCYRVGEGDAWQVTPAPDGFERNAMFLSQMEHFLAVVRGEQKPVCSLQDGLQALRIILAIQHSADTGKLAVIESPSQ
jgi:predicted dehydrogenase